MAIIPIDPSLDLTEFTATGSINNMIKRSGEFKNLLIRTMLDRSAINANEVQSYLGAINSFLRSWSDYAEKLSDEMSNAKVKNNANVTSIEYEDVKDYMYAKYDYASVLQYADGLIKGLETNKFETAEDVRDFFDYTTSKAFKDRESNVGMMVGNVMPSVHGPELESADAKEIAYFNSCHKYNWYDRRDRIEIYKAIEKVVEFICNDYRFGKLIHEDKSVDNKGIIKVAIINSIVDYINYTLAAYATRIFIISIYAKPYIHSQGGNEYTEAADIIDSSITRVACNAFHEIDDSIIRDISKYCESIRLIGEALNCNGCDSNTFTVDDASACYNSFNNKNNPFCDKLANNMIHASLTNTSGYRMWNVYSGSPDCIAEVNQLMNANIFNAKQVLSTSYSPKQELLMVIRELMPEKDTVEGIQSFMYSLMNCTFGMLKTLNSTANCAAEYYSNGTNKMHPDKHYTQTTMKELSNIIKMSKDLYSEISSAAIARVRDLEIELNQKKNASQTALFAQLEIKLPGVKQSGGKDIDTAVPDTTRIPMTVMDMTASPMHEYLDMYDEYVKVIYGLDDDVYFSEGFNEIMNTIESYVNAFIEKMQRFFTDKKFEAARKWVAANKENMLNMTYSGKLNAIIPYPEKVNIDTYITPLANKLKELPNKINNEVLMSNQKVEGLIKELYCTSKGPDQNAYNLFNSANNDAKKSSEAYANYILFGGPEAIIGKVEAPAPLQNVDVSGAEFKTKYLTPWMNTITSTEPLYDQLNKTLDGVKQSLKDIKSKVVQFTGDTTAATNATNTQNKPTTDAKSNPPETPTPAPANDKKDDTKTESVMFEEGETATATATPAASSGNDNKDAAKTTDKAANATQLLNGTQKACNNLIFGIYMPLTRAITNQYKYIKLAYTLGNKDNQTPQQ